MVSLGLLALYFHATIRHDEFNYTRKSPSLGVGIIAVGMFLLIIGYPTDRRGNAVNGWREGLFISAIIGFVVGLFFC